MRRLTPYGLVPVVLLAVGCTDPNPVAPRIPRAVSLATDCALGMSDADAIAALDALTAAVNALEASGSLSAGQANALRKHLENVRKSIATGNYCAAASQLTAFKEQVSNFVNEGSLTEEEAEPLTGGATDVLDGVYYVSFASFRDGNWETYSARSDGTNLVNHTNNSAHDVFAEWSPDGSKLAFASDREGVWRIFTVNADGSGLTRLTDSDVTDGNLHWSPDGSRIAFVRHYAVREVWVMNRDGSNQTRVIDGDWPQWSPDGTRLVYNAYRNGNSDIFSIGVDGTGEIQVSNDPLFDGYPLWSPDGSQIVWRTERHGNTELYSANPDGSGTRRLTNTTIFSHPSSFSPDGKLLTVNRCTPAPNAVCQIYLLRMDGTGETNISNDPTVSEFEAMFSPDGKRLVFQREWTTGFPSADDIYIMNPDGSGRRKITDSASDNNSPNWRTVR